MNNDFSSKKVLLLGLGLLGGGVATANWLLRQGTVLTITDLKDKKQLASSLKKIKGVVKLRLGYHDKDDIKQNDTIVINPDVSVYNPYVKLAKKLKKRIENEATIFYKNCPLPMVAITGTRGKTTTANWTTHFLNAKYKAIASGNSYGQPLLKTLESISRFTIVVNEIPSFHLELFDRSIPPPVVAVVTNIYRDHLNRYRSFEDYALTKANIFRSQTQDNNLILNHDNRWTPFLLKQKPKSKVWFFSSYKLPIKYNGVFYADSSVYFQINRKKEKIFNIAGFTEKWGRHNLENLLAGSLAAHLTGISWTDIKIRIESLPQIPFRQEIIFESKKLKIVNDTCATSPDGGIAALERFGGPNTILIAGGTDRELDFKKWSEFIKKNIQSDNLILLSGSATDKMTAILGKYQTYDRLEECIKIAMSKVRKTENFVILFSPACKSFEKFENEYDRGRQFNKFIRKWILK